MKPSRIMYLSLVLMISLGLSRPVRDSFAATPKPLPSPTDISCVPIQVVVFTTASRFHVRCSAAVGGISYFALSTADAPQAARVLSILTTAQVAGRTLVINYDPADLSGASIGCQANDCRLIRAVGFGQ